MKNSEDRHHERIHFRLHHSHKSGFGRMALGILLLGFGALILVRSLGMMSKDVEDIVFSWQMFLIALGVLLISKSENRISGTVLILVGGFFMLNEFADLPLNMKQLFWACLFILIGIMILFRGIWHPFQRFDNKIPDQDTLDYVDELNVFGGSEKRIITKNFKGGKITNIFGGCTLDFSEASLADGIHVIDAVSIFGGFKFIIPHDWTVKLEATSVLGGITDKRTHVNEQPDPGKMLVIRGSAIFGGGEIKNY